MDMNRKFLLANRPRAEPSPSNFSLVEEPVGQPGEGQVLARSIWLSVDPYMRGRMRPSRSYADPAGLGEIMVGSGVGEVLASRSPRFGRGDIVEGDFGWQTMPIIDADELDLVDPGLAPISTALGVLGMPGMTAYFGYLEVGRPQPGDTVLVSAASGAVGGIVGQMARIGGARAVGIVGSDAKRQYCLERLGFDACINRRTEDIGAALDRECPDGIDVYFDNVGGAILDATLARINLGARIAICGMISEYNLPEPELAVRPTRALLTNRATMQGLLVRDWWHRRQHGRSRLARWIADGQLYYREETIEGFENMPQALIGLLEGENFGKRLVKVGDAPDGVRAGGDAS